jgi:hypothetical protein
LFSFFDRLFFLVSCFKNQLTFKMKNLVFCFILFITLFITQSVTAQTDSVKKNSEIKLHKNSAGIEHFSTTTLSLNYQRFIGKRNHFAIAAGYGSHFQYKYMLANIYGYWYSGQNKHLTIGIGPQLIAESGTGQRSSQTNQDYTYDKKITTVSLMTEGG